MIKINNNYDDIGFVAKDIDTNEYFIGSGNWDKQIRKAKIYHSWKYVNEIKEDIKFIERDIKIFRVGLFEMNECDEN